MEIFRMTASVDGGAPGLVLWGSEMTPWEK